MVQRIPRTPAKPTLGSPPSSPPAGQAAWWDDPRWAFGFGLALVGAVFAVYYPVWRAGFIWDDDGHVTRLGLRSLSGLGRIWTDPGATQQYYPLLHSLFWILHGVFGAQPAGYHLFNIGLHAANALLVWRVLSRLQVPGAPLAAAIFALHPVMVESVAWVSELKNTLSTCLYLGAALAYLRYDQERRPAWFSAAFGLFLLAVLSKTVTATLPAALLVVFWWQRGRLDWRRDAVPLLLFFIVGTVAGLFTAALERSYIGAHGTDFDFSFVERCLIAGHALWFYAGKIIWPANLIFIYPRWPIANAGAAQSLWPLAAGILLLALGWWARRRRGPLAGALFFAGTLFPALGFFNVYPFQFSFVADHFQYLASLGLIVPLAAGLAGLLPTPRALLGVGGVLAAVLGALTFVQSRQYVSVETLYTTTVARNPGAWLAWINLGEERLQARRYEQAIACFQSALQVKPGQPKAHYNLGVAYVALGRMPAAIAEFQAALDAVPEYTNARFNLGSALASEGRLKEALIHLRLATRSMTSPVGTHRLLGQALLDSGYPTEAAAELREAVRLNPYDRAARELLESLPPGARGNP